MSPSLIRLLKDVNVEAISLVPSGDNEQRIFLFKSANDDARSSQLSAGALLPEGDWSAFYVVVAEPGREEGPGLYGEAGTRDVWASEEEIRKAAHRFMKNGGLINRMHESMEPYGQLVENAIAHEDFTVETPLGPQTVRKGSWYIAVEPTDEGRRKIESGELAGVSIEGEGVRVEKYDPRMIRPDLERSPRENWVDRVGGFPKTNWIARAATHMHRKGMTISHAIAVAVNAAKRLCATGDLNFKGVQSADPRARADACKAVAEWEAMKARSGVSKSKVPKGTQMWEVEETAEQIDGVFSGLGLDPAIVQKQMDDGLLHKIGVALGVASDDDGDPLGDYDPIVKREVSTEERKKLASEGKALSGGGFPIANCSDVANAVQAIGRAKDPEATKRHIAKRARALDCADKIPESWGLRKEGATVESKMELNERVEKIEEAQKEQGEKIDALAKSVPDDLDEKLDKIAKAVAEKPEEKPDEKASKDGDGADDDKVDLAKLSKDVAEVAEAQGTIANGLVSINERLEKAEAAGQSSLVDADDDDDDGDKTKLSKGNGKHPLSGILD